MRVMAGDESVVDTKTITDPWFRENVMRIGMIYFDLLPQLSDENAEVFSLLGVITAPNSR